VLRNRSAQSAAAAAMVDCVAHPLSHSCAA